MFFKTINYLYYLKYYILDSKKSQKCIIFKILFVDVFFFLVEKVLQSSLQVNLFSGSLCSTDNI